MILSHIQIFRRNSCVFSDFFIGPDLHPWVIEGTVSQIFYSGSSSGFMCFQKLCSQFFLNVS